MARNRSDEQPQAVRRPSSTRRRELLDIAARLFAERGYGGASVDDLGAAAGITGPAFYWHFPSKEALLAEMLTDVSERLLDGAGHCVAAADGAAAALVALVEFQATFAVEHPSLITVHHRELPHLAARDSLLVRRTQRRYLDVWVQVLAEQHPTADPTDLLAATHAVFGLLNSTPNLPSGDPARQHALLVSLALGALASLGERPSPVLDAPGSPVSGW